MIKPCTCRHAMQDQEHGHGQRVHNPMKPTGWRCSVCGTEKEVSKGIALKEIKNDQ